MAAFHLSLSDFKHSTFSNQDESHAPLNLDPSDSDYAKSLIFSLQSNLQDLKNEANSLKNVTFRETAGSNIQTFRTPEKVLDYRKTSNNLTKASIKGQSEVRASANSPKDAKLDYPSYGRGVDPAPDVDFGYMNKKSGKANVAPLKKVMYEKNFEKYLSEKYQKKNLNEENRPFYWEEPQIIKFLRDEYLRLTKRTENKLLKTNLVNELIANPDLGELFGVDESVPQNSVIEIVANIGDLDFINIDQFLQFYQVSRNNLLKSKQVFLEKQSKESAPPLKLKIEFLINKFAFSKDHAQDKSQFILSLQDWLKPDILDILQTPPIIFESLPDFIKAFNESDCDLSTESLLGLFEPAEVIDFIIPINIIESAKIVFDSLEESGKVDTQQLINQLFEDEVIMSSLQVEARSPQGLPSIPSETLSQLLERIQSEAPEWLTWEEFVRYFSIEGRPVEDQPVTTTELKAPLGFRYKITVPAPFNFMRRDSIKQPSIRERRLVEMLQEKEQVIDKELSNKFKAKPVPPEIKIPLFKIIMDEQDQRRQVLKTQFEALTKSMEKPFSFYIRDLAKPPIKPPEEPVHVFHANQVPWFVKIDRSEEFKQQEELRKDRISKMARHTLSLAKMPARMESAARELKEVDESKAKSQTKFHTVQFKAKDVPDFAAQQEKFAKALLDKKGSFNPTVPTPFNFHESHKAQEALKLLDYPDVAKENWADKQKKHKRPASAFSRPKITPGTTQKTKDLISVKQEYFEKVKEKQEEKIKQEEHRRIKHEMMKKAMKKAGTVKKYSLKSVYEEKVKQRKDEMRRNEKEYMVKLQEITEKVANRPFLIDQVASSNLSRDLEGMGPVRRMLNQEYISEAVTSQEQEVSSESYE